GKVISARGVHLHIARREIQEHFQYTKSGGLVILSDLQGSSTLLTDAQIMTSFTLTDKEVFGGGNIPTIFDRFEVEHQCNVYCRAFGMLPFKVSDEEGAKF
ncbi:unnamed protein product, partial [Mycena citricolor]